MNFTNEQIEKAKNCKTLEEFNALAKAEGLNLTDVEAEKYFNATRGGELNDDELSAVAGGKGWVVIYDQPYGMTCPFCRAEFDVHVKQYKNSSNEHKYEVEPDVCTCGAFIRYHSTTMNFDFEKDGERRDPIRVIKK